MIRLIALLTLAVVILSGCDNRDAVDVTGNDPRSPVSSPGSSVEVDQPVEPTATPPPATATVTTSSIAEFGCCTTTVGAIVEINLRDGVGTLLVFEHPEDPTSGEQYQASLSADTRVREWTADGAESRTLSDLNVGQRVIVSFVGAIATSIPALGVARDIEILRTKSGGPIDLADRVTQTFVLSLFNGYGDAPPMDDDFYVEYVDAGGNADQRFFCGDDPRATEVCRGSGTTYQIQVTVPRGSELRSIVYRVSGPAPGTVEPGDHFDIVLDTDLTSNAHYRYLSTDPWGFR